MLLAEECVLVESKIATRSRLCTPIKIRCQRVPVTVQELAEIAIVTH